MWRKISSEGFDPGVLSSSQALSSPIKWDALSSLENFLEHFEPNFVGIFELKAKVSQNIQLVCFPALILNFRGCAVYLRSVYRSSSAS
jgi:hypothetical protein